LSIHSLARYAAGVALIGVVAATPHAYAQAVTDGVACSNQTRQALVHIGTWAEAQCEPDGSLRFMPMASGYCTDLALQGLERIGGWAEVQCES